MLCHSRSFVFIQGHEMEKAIAKMHEGDKALVIIPSELAFGAEGSVEGIVPPFTPVVFEIELINVK